MKNSIRLLVLTCLVAAITGTMAQDWPQWRGANRDGRAAGFNCPKSWPEKLSQKWKVTVGRGDASPDVVGDKVYVFTRQDKDESLACLDAASGKELWRDKYEAPPVTGPASRHPGPRSSPAVAEGKVVTYGALGAVSCLDAASGKVLWRKNDSGGAPRFFTSSSPLITDGLCIVQIGGEEKGALVAYELGSGNEKWRWADDGTGYSSPVLLKLDGTRMLVAMTAKKVIGVDTASGKLLWETTFPTPGRAYNAATPIVDGTTVVFAGSGRGTKALKLAKEGDAFSPKDLWANPDNGVQFNSPVLKANRIYGLAQKGDLFCLDATDGKTLWTAPLGGRDFGSVVDAGTVLLALTPQGELTVFEPNEKEYKKLASYKVADNEVYAHPVPAGKGIYIKDQDSVALWALE